MSSVSFSPPPLFPTVNDVRAAARVRGPDQWQRMADASNWILGRGSQLIGAGPVGTWIAASGSVSVPYYIWPRQQYRFRTWLITLVANNEGGASGTIGTDLGTGTVITWQVAPRPPLAGILAPTDYALHLPVVVRFYEKITSPTAAPGPITLTLTNNSSSAASVRILAVSCFETPLTNVTDSLVSGFHIPDPLTDAVRFPIYAESVEHASVNGVMRAQDAIVTEGRRSSLFSWASVSGVTITSTSFAGGNGNAFRIPITLNERTLYAAQSTGTVHVAYLASCSGSGRFKITSAASTFTDSFTAASPAWFTFDLTVSSENLSTIDSSTAGDSAESIVVDMRATSGSFHVVLYGLAIGGS